MAGFAAIVLAGGAARRMGGVDKPAVRVGGRPMLERVLAAVYDAVPRIVVGPTGSPLRGALTTREDPPGGGPVAATAAGLSLITPGSTVVALFAADLPLMTTHAAGLLRQAVERSTVDGACYVDADGRDQLLCGVWRVAALRAAVDRVAGARGGVLAGASMRTLVRDLAVRRVRWTGSRPPPWFDCDTDDDLRRAEEWVR